MAEPPVPPVPAQPVPPTLDDLLRVYLQARGPTRAEYVAMNDTLTRLADSLNGLTETKLKDMIREGVKEGVKDLATKASVEARLADSVKDLASKDDLKEIATKANVKAAVRNLATKASVESTVQDNVKNLATQVSVEDVSCKADDVKVLLERMNYNDRIRSFNSARIARGDLPLLPLLDAD